MSSKLRGMIVSCWASARVSTPSPLLSANSNDWLICAVVHWLGGSGRVTTAPGGVVKRKPGVTGSGVAGAAGAGAIWAPASAAASKPAAAARTEAKDFMANSWLCLAEGVFVLGASEDAVVIAVHFFEAVRHDGQTLGFRTGELAIAIGVRANEGLRDLQGGVGSGAGHDRGNLPRGSAAVTGPAQHRGLRWHCCVNRRAARRCPG